MNKNNNSINTIGILASLLMLALCYLARMDLYAYVSGFNYITLFALAATIFSLPDFLCYYFPSKNRWYGTSEFYTIFLIIFLGIVGILLPKYSAWLGFTILPIGISLAFWEIYHFIRSKNLLTLAAGLALMGFIVFLFYSKSYVSPLFTEQIILGNAHIDTLFLSSMSNMFSTLGWPSTGLDGSPFVHYHWGSLALFGGLKNWIGLNTLLFYNVAYPVIFIPLFLKSLFYFLNRLFIYKGSGSVNLLFAISFITVLYSMTLAGFNYAPPFRYESLNISLIFSFLYGATLLAFINKPNNNIILFNLYSIIILLLISSAKISTGFVCVIGMVYLYIRTYKNFKNILLLSIALIIIVGLIYFFIYPRDRFTYSVGFAKRISNFWVFPGSFIVYLSGMLIAILVLLKNQSMESWSKIRFLISSREYIDLEILFIITISSFLGAMILSSFPADVYMFCIPQFFISIPFLILFGQRYFDRFAASAKAKTLFLFLLIFLSIVSNPDAVRTYQQRITSVKKNMRGLSQQQKVLQGFLVELFTLEKEDDKNKICIYIPQTEKWYYESQSDQPLGQQSKEFTNPLSSPMVVPAITGIALIGGIPDSIYNSNYNYPGYFYYKKDGQFQVKDLNDAKNRAVQKGYSELIEYQCIEGVLLKQKFDLRN